jgi:hypothetical protein
MKISLFGVLGTSVLLTVCACSSSSSDGGSSGGSSGETSSSAGSNAGGSAGTGTGSAGASTADAGASTGGSSSGGGSSEAAFSCTRTADGTCASYSSVPPNSASTYCSDGTVVTTCPMTGLQATCTFTSAGVDEVFYYYTSGGYSNTAIKTVCDSESGTLVTF